MIMQSSQIMNDCITIAQIGCGYWGPNLLRNFSALPNCRVKYVVDASPARRAFVHQLSAECGKRIRRRSAARPEVCGGGGHTRRHALQFGQECLLAGKHIFDETSRHQSREVDELAACAAKRDLVVMAGHLHLQRRRPLCEEAHRCR